ncbi:hypothetical protein [Haloarcula laminariae]|nr:hypothetical protein [Halomicroarcula laminariae]
MGDASAWTVPLLPEHVEAATSPRALPGWLSWSPAWASTEWRATLANVE